MRVRVDQTGHDDRIAEVTQFVVAEIAEDVVRRSGRNNRVVAGRDGTGADSLWSQQVGATIDWHAGTLDKRGRERTTAVDRPATR